MTLKFFIFIVISLFAYSYLLSNANDSCNIYIRTNTLNNNSVKLGYYYGPKTFLKEEIKISQNGTAYFKNKVYKGIYFIELTDSSIYEFMIDGKENLTIDINLLDNKYICKATGNPITEAYDGYQKSMDRILDKADSIFLILKNSQSEINKKNKLIDERNKEIINLQKSTASLYPGSLLQSYLNAFVPFDISTIQKKSSDENVPEGMFKNLYLYKEHYFDNINLNDERLIFTPILSDKINYYFDKIVRQHPDTISKEIYKIFMSINNQKVRKFFLDDQFEKYNHLKNKATSELIYAYIIENIYLKGHAPWEKFDFIKQLESEIKRIKPLLVNQIAPDIKLQGTEGTDLSLYSISAGYKILVFWDTECPLCIRIIKDLNKAISAYNYLSLGVFTVCTAKDTTTWNNLIMKNFPKTWLNTIEVRNNSTIKTYNITTTPTLFLLDTENRIINKNFTVTELEKILLKIATNRL